MITPDQASAIFQKISDAAKGTDNDLSTSASWIANAVHAQSFFSAQDITDRHFAHYPNMCNIFTAILSEVEQPNIEG
jgi:predicted heme/steroid binding protein